MINGLYRHGFMIAPAALDCALQVLEQGSSKTALELGLSITHGNHRVEAVCA
jgi:glycine oxidase